MCVVLPGLVLDVSPCLLIHMPTPPAVTEPGPSTRGISAFRYGSGKN